MTTKIKMLLSIVLLCMIGTATFALAMTDQEKQNLIAQLQQQLASLQQQLVQLVSQQAGSTTWCYGFNNGIGFANSGTNDVFNLHLALSKEGISYAPDGTTDYSTGTAQAVVNFQGKYNIYPQSGYVGPLTRAKLNSLYGCANTTPQTTCSPNWKCYDWNTCYNGSQNRSCYDANSCNTDNGKPQTMQLCSKTNCNRDSDCGYSGFEGSPFCQAGDVWQIYTTWHCGNPGTYLSSCGNDKVAKLNTKCNLNQYCSNGSCSVYNCTPSWRCTGFGACVNGVQTQDCNDINNCQDSTNKPSEAQACGSSSSNSACVPSWNCGTWGSCYNNQQSRYCYDSHNCGQPNNGVLPTTQSCTCTPNWQCGAWTTCSGGQQYHSCYDSNNCGVNTGKPNSTQSC